MQHTDPAGWMTVVNTTANLAIVGGYATVPFTVLRRLPVTTFVRVAGVFFFLGCAISHVHMSMDRAVSWWLMSNHVVQAAAVWCFVVGFARLVADANRRRTGRTGGGDPATSVPR